MTIAPTGRFLSLPIGTDKWNTQRDTHTEIDIHSERETQTL